MDGQTQNPLLSREERAALEAAIVDICAFKAASTETASLASSRLFANHAGGLGAIRPGRGCASRAFRDQHSALAPIQHCPKAY